MAKARTGGKVLDEGRESWELIVEYAKQETLEPLKGMGRFLLFGVSGSVVMGAGLIFLVVGFLRLLQDETGSTFEGHLSWLPYLICLVPAGGVLAGTAMLALRGGWKRTKRRSLDATTPPDGPKPQGHDTALSVSGPGRLEEATTGTGAQQGSDPAMDVTSGIGEGLGPKEEK